MSISKKVFWIFLSVAFIITALGATVYLYQLGNKRMHDVMHNLIQFNNRVHELKLFQNTLITGKSDLTVYELQRRVNSLQQSSTKLFESLNEFDVMAMSLKSLSVDIDNYRDAVAEYMDESDQYAILVSEQYMLRDKLFNKFKRENLVISEDFIILDNFLHFFVEDNNPALITQINSQLGKLKERDVNNSEKLIVRFKTVVEKIYLKRLSLLEKHDFLQLSSEHLIGIISKVNYDLKLRDAKINRLMRTSALLIMVFSFGLAFFYWFIINRYVKRFLQSHSEVMSAIKGRRFIKNPEPFSRDELGDLTQKMWELAGELHEKDEELIASEKKYRTYINTTPLAVIVTDKDRYIIEVNPGAEKLLGYSSSEFQTMRLDDIWPDIDTLSNLGQFDRLKLEGTQTVLRRLHSKDKKEVYTNVSAIKLKDNVFVAFYQDITERIRLEKELTRINENLMEQVRQEVDKNMKQDQIIQQQKKLADMGMMMSAIAHQWRQPLNALALCVQDVVEEFDSSSLTKEYLVDFEENTMKLIMHMSKTIDDFRDFFIPDKSVAKFNVISELRDIIRLLNVQIFAHNIDVEISCRCSEKYCSSPTGDICCESEEYLVEGFPGEFKQVIINLIYNSVDSINELIVLGVQSRGSIKMKVNIGTEYLTIQVSDNGKGIEDHVMPRIFEPYFTTKPEGKGTGIGLYMSKVIIENHMGGKIRAVDSNRGACFEVELPIAEVIKGA